MQRRDLQFDSILKRGLQGARDSGSRACPEESTLAGYCDRSLSRTETARCEEHLSNCARCQATVAAIARARADAVGTPPMGRRWGLYAALAAAVVGMSVAASLMRRGAIPAPALHSVSPKMAALRSKAPEAGAQIALNEPANREAPELAPPGTAETPPPAHPRGIAPQQPNEFAKQRLTAPGEHEGEALPAASEKPNYFGLGPPAAPGPTAPAPPPEAAVAESAPMTGAGAASGMSMGRLVSARPAMVSVRTADNVERWRLGADGTIEHREPGGVWQRQDSGVAAALRAGAAPSPTLCWVVGSDGTILRTTDAEHWQKIKSPTSADLIAVFAVDGSSATVTTADGKRFSTTDGGQSWRPI